MADSSAFWEMKEIEQEITALFERMSLKGKDPGGGYTRLAYTKQWLEGRNAVQEILKEIGLETWVDNVGNLYGRLNGKRPGTIMTGSHIDTVRNGGLYDGLYGVLASALSVKLLKEKFGVPEKGLEVVVISAEEASRFPYPYWGSRNVIGTVTREEAAGIVDADGVTLAEGLAAMNLSFGDKGSGNKRPDIEAFLEIHIEQGGILEKENKSIGIVENIAGIRKISVDITGEANHAGTTPLPLRRDPMKTAAATINEILHIADRYGPPLVATVGRIAAMPNQSNVIPGNVFYTIDIRHPSEEVLDKFISEVRSVVAAKAREHTTTAEVTQWMEEKPAPMNKKMMHLYEEICRIHNIPCLHMNSGAGHDSQVFSQVCDTAMLFVPSKGGVSHSPEEYTQPEYLACGVFVLANALHQLAYGA